MNETTPDAMRLPNDRPVGSRYLPWFVALTGLFLFRVLAQLIEALHPTGVLPPFQSWQGSNLPYPVLLLAQVVILGLMAWVIAGVRGRTVRPSRIKASIYIAFGSVYLAVMAFRLIVGLSVLADVPWFATPLPAFFHMVLASFVILLGLYHRATHG